MADTARFLQDFVLELAEAGDRSFRQRYREPVLIVSGRVARKRPRGEGTEAKTSSDRPDRPTLHALLDRVFHLIKAPEAPAGPVVVGRADAGVDGVDVSIPDASISKRHCQFGVLNGAATIADCGSRNGTTVNGMGLLGIESRRLAGGETIVMGRLQLIFETAAGFLEFVGSLRR